MTPGADSTWRVNPGAPPLMPVQEDMWSQVALMPDVPAYTMATAFRVLGPLRVSALRAALGEVVARHEVLRTTFGPLHQGSVLRVSAATPYHLAVVDLSRVKGDRPSRALERAQLTALAEFDLSRAPLLRGSLFRLGPGDHVFVLVTHHLVFDGWSVGLLLRELSVLYAAFCAGRPPPLSPQAVQYGDLAVLARARLDSGVRITQLAYWVDQLQAPPPPCLSAEPATGAVSFGRGRIPVRLTSTLSRAVSDLAQEEGATEFMVLLAGLQVMLAMVTGQPDIRVGSHVANRMCPEAFDQLGLFANTIVLRSYVDPSLTFRRFLRQVRATALAAYQHAEVPIAEVAAAVSARPPFEVMLQLQNANPATLELEGTYLTPFPPDGLIDDQVRPMAVDLLLDLTPSARCFAGTCFYRPDRLTDTTVQSWLDLYQAVLSDATTDPDVRVSALSESHDRSSGLSGIGRQA